MNRLSCARRYLRRLIFLAAGLLLLGACGGDNAWEGLPTGGGSAGGGKGSRSGLEILSPDTARRVAVGDSVLVRVRATNRQGLASLELSGFALRGSVSLGTDERVPRFATKAITFDSLGLAPVDTTISRYLLATGDSVPEDSVFVVVTATDLRGATSSDTVRIAIGGPRAEIVSPLAGAGVRAGTALPVRLSASDTEFGIESVTLEARASGLEEDVTVRLAVRATMLDTVVRLPIPSTASGDLRLVAVAHSSNNDSATSDTVVVRLLAPIADDMPPTLSFQVTVPARAERADSVVVAVSAIDSTEVGRVGITVVPTHRLADGTRALPVFSLDSIGEARTFRFALDQLQLAQLPDTSTVRLEITAFAVDTAGNCAAATIPGTTLSEACRSVDGAILANRAGARSDVLLVRGATVGLGPTDRIADLVSNGRRVFLSNISRNRVDVIEVGETRVSRSIPVGSRPWGMAFNKDRSRLYVANSGGTNISVVSPTELTENRSERILTPNVKLFDVPYTVEDDSVSGAHLYPGSVTRYDFSDRPQYIGVTQSEDLVYSTRPTGAAPDGTLRIFYTADERLEFVTQYLEERPGSKVIVVNADSAFLVTADPNNLISVCPRDRSVNPALDRNLGEVCIVGPIDAVEDSITRLGYDTRFLYNRQIEELGLSDTTFVAVSGDHSTVAFGEGDRDNARVMVLTDPGGAGPIELVKHGEIRDLVGNAAERVIGLGLNSNGSLGVARGAEAYYFSRDLRLQGVVDTGSPSGGVDMHPNDPSPQRSFVSGVEAGGLAYIDVIDTFHFRRTGRIFLRDPVTGPIRAVHADGALIIYAVTDRGVVAIEVASSDL